MARPRSSKVNPLALQLEVQSIKREIAGLESASPLTAWGDITGTLADQTDLQAALDAKADTSHTHNASAITAGTLPITRGGTGSTTLPLVTNYTGGAHVSLYLEGIDNALGDKAATSHTHAQSDITNLTTDLAAKGDASMLYGAISDTSNTSNTSYTSVIGSDVTVEAGKTYAISWRMRTYSAAATTGVRLRRVLGGGAAGTVVFQTSFVGSSATAGFTRASREGTNDPALGTGNATNSTDQCAALWVDMLFTCTTGGTVGLEMASEVNASGAFITGDGSGWFAVVRNT